jgi:hypothetical protein
MRLAPLPMFASGRHRDARDGYEGRVPANRLRGSPVPRTGGGGRRRPAVGGRVLDRRRCELGHAERAGDRAVGVGPSRSPASERRRGRLVDRRLPAPQLAGCLDVDLEASAFTNALPVHRLLSTLASRPRLGPSMSVRWTSRSSGSSSATSGRHASVTPTQAPRFDYSACSSTTTTVCFSPPVRRHARRAAS